MTEQREPLRLKLGAHGLASRMAATVIHREVLGLPKNRRGAPEHRGHHGSCRWNGFDSKLVNTKDRRTHD